MNQILAYSTRSPLPLVGAADLPHKGAYVRIFFSKLSISFERNLAYSTYGQVVLDYERYVVHLKTLIWTVNEATVKACLYEKL